MFFDPFKKRTTCKIVFHMHLSGHSVIYFIFFQGKSKENLALISHNSQWDPMVMKLWPWKTSLELKR